MCATKVQRDYVILHREWTLWDTRSCSGKAGQISAWQPQFLISCWRVCLENCINLLLMLFCIKYEQKMCDGLFVCFFLQWGIAQQGQNRELKKIRFSAWCCHDAWCALEWVISSLRKTQLICWMKGLNYIHDFKGPFNIHFTFKKLEKVIFTKR